MAKRDLYWIGMTLKENGQLVLFPLNCKENQFLSDL